MMKYWEIKDRAIVRGGINPFADNVETAGRKCAAVIYYGTGEDGTLNCNFRLFFPMLRKIPNDTHATLRHDVPESGHIAFSCGGAEVKEYPEEYRIDGVLSVTSRGADGKLIIKRYYFPSTEKSAFIEYVTVMNVSDGDVKIGCTFPDGEQFYRGTKGIYSLRADSRGEKETVLEEGEAAVYATVYSGRVIADDPVTLDPAEELMLRRSFAEEIFSESIVLECPDESVNTEFAFSKLRISESVFDTLRGPMHCPGGQAYYAAVWANDEAEYAAPYFGFSGFSGGVGATVNMMELYRPFMGPEMHMIPSSIIAEGLDIWEGAGDEGDASMYLYGVTRFLLSRGDRDLAEKYFDTVDWCVRYISTKETDDHVITSDCDELEARFKIGNANLLTSSLSYGGLRCAADLAKSLGYDHKEREYNAFAERLKAGIEAHFGTNFKGYETYVYYTGCDILRSYICAPLTVGLTERAEGTVLALMENLYTENGFLTAEGDKMFWDRSTLYCFRGIFAAGMADKIYPAFRDYTEKRLLSEHVPYPIEAWPEGNQRHLSAEGGLYCRTVIEGLFGITPTGLSSFSVKPSLPAEWRGKKTALRRVDAFGTVFDIEIEYGENYKMTVTDGERILTKTVSPGDSAVFEL